MKPPSGLPQDAFSQGGGGPPTPPQKSSPTADSREQDLEERGREILEEVLD